MVKRLRDSMGFLKGKSGALFSANRLYRYALWRIWNRKKGFFTVIGLNPSTADEYKNDPTVTRCIKRAKNWGYGGLIMVNLFGLRSTKPEVMLNNDHPNGLDNNYWLQRSAYVSKMILAAWGINGDHMHRANFVKELLEDHTLWTLAINKGGTPKHPLYCKDNAEPILIQGADYDY